PSTARRGVDRVKVSGSAESAIAVPCRRPDAGAPQASSFAPPSHRAASGVRASPQRRASENRQRTPCPLILAVGFAKGGRRSNHPLSPVKSGSQAFFDLREKSG